MTSITVKLTPVGPSDVPPEVRLRRALKALLREHRVRAEWSPPTTHDAALDSNGAASGAEGSAEG
jgi:hypothetical protein